MLSHFLQISSPDDLLTLFRYTRSETGYLPRGAEVEAGCGMRVRGDGCLREGPSPGAGSLLGAK